eukprot:6174417-Pleurochrysis_carterae.AAC.3
MCSSAFAFDAAKLQRKRAYMLLRTHDLHVAAGDLIFSTVVRVEERRRRFRLACSVLAGARVACCLGRMPRDFPGVPRDQGACVPQGGGKEDLQQIHPGARVLVRSEWAIDDFSRAGVERAQRLDSSSDRLHRVTLCLAHGLARAFFRELVHACVRGSAFSSASGSGCGCALPRLRGRLGERARHGLAAASYARLLPAWAREDARASNLSARTCALRPRRAGIEQCRLG